MIIQKKITILKKNLKKINFFKNKKNIIYLYK